MKKLVLLTLLLIALSVPALAEVDLSGMTYDELVALKDQINLAMWNSQEWQEVTVPQGVWKIGEDIPEGHWSITASDGVWARVSYSSALDDNQKEADYHTKDYYSSQVNSTTYRSFDPNKDISLIDIDAKNGAYIVIEYGSVVFTPYAGKATLGFK